MKRRFRPNLAEIDRVSRHEAECRVCSTRAAEMTTQSAQHLFRESPFGLPRGALVPDGPAEVELDRRLARMLRAAQAVSFDVFDTAVLRALAQPVDLFRLMETAVSRILGEDSNFVVARPQAEATARERAWRNRRSAEVSLDEIYDVLGEMMGLDPGTASPLIQAELDTEFAVCRGNPFIHVVYRWCLDHDKRVAFISDTYWPQSAIAELLQRCGYDAYDALLVSSAAGKSKADGKLHREARSLLPARRWLHIGDNYDSDVVMARKQRMKTWHYFRCSDVAAQRQRGACNWQQPLEPARAVASVTQGLVANRLTAARPILSHAKDSTAFWRDFGYAAAGPLFVGFTEWLIAQTAAQELEALYFLARDGLIMQRVYEALAPMSGGGLETHYLWGSRRALNLAAIDEIDERALHFLTAGNGRLEARHYVDRLGLDWHDHVDAFRAAGFADPRQRVNDDRSEASLRRLFGLLAGPVCERARQERSIVVDYLRHTGITGDRRIGLVDIGWHGSIQRSITNILDEDGTGPHITGFYVGTLAHRTPLIHRKYPHKAYLFRLGQPAAYADLIVTCIELVELLFSAAEGSIMRIERDGRGGFTAVRDADSLDDTRYEAIRRLQEGAMDFVDDYVELKRRFPEFAMPRYTAVATLRRVLLHPTPVEARFIGDIRHADAFGEILKRPIVQQPNWLRLFAGLGAFRRELRDVYWTAGRAARANRIERAIYRLVTR